MTINNHVIANISVFNISVRRYIDGKTYSIYASTITTTKDKLISDCKQDIETNSKIKTDNMIIKHMTSKIIWLSDSLFDVRIELI